MTVIDLSREFVLELGEKIPVGHRHLRLESGQTAYTALVHDFSFISMAGSYIDLPGHIVETDDGRRTDTVDAAEFFRIPAQVIRLERASGSGAVTAADLEAASGGAAGTPALIVNALGKLGPHDIAKRSVYFDLDAVDWIIASGCKVLLSDIYESRRLEGVFVKLFAAGICAVCEPAGLHRLTADRAKLTVMFPPYPETVQAPCRIIAEF